MEVCFCVVFYVTRYVTRKIHSLNLGFHVFKKKMAKSIKRQALSIQDPCLYDKSKKKTPRLHILFYKEPLCWG